MRLGKEVLEADLYGALGILPDATESEIRVAYRRQVRASHPDLNQSDPEAVPRMKRLNVAARVLLDPALRRTYDQAPRGARTENRPAPRRPSAWYERSELGLDDDWVPAPAPERPEAAGRCAVFFQQLRGRDGQVSLRLQAALESLSPGQQLTFAAALCALALLLIGMSRPQGLVGDSRQPTSVDPGSVYP